MMDCHSFPCVLTVRPKHVYPVEIGYRLRKWQMYFSKSSPYASVAALIWLSAGLADCGMHWRSLTKQDKAQLQRIALLFSEQIEKEPHSKAQSHILVYVTFPPLLSLVSLSVPFTLLFPHLTFLSPSFNRLGTFFISLWLLNSLSY